MSYSYETCLHFRLITPDRQVFPDPEAERTAPVVWVDVPGVEGDFGVLPAHAPMVATIRPAILTVDPHDENLKERFVVIGGFAELSHRKREEKNPSVKEDEEWATDLTVLAEFAVRLEKFDRSKLTSQINDAEEDLADASDQAVRDKLGRHLDQLKALQAALSATPAADH
jgi:F-type H+-transporting ATPase subunit epsilon